MLKFIFQQFVLGLNLFVQKMKKWIEMQTSGQSDHEGGTWC